MEARDRSCSGGPTCPLISFSIFWFALATLIVSANVQAKPTLAHAEDEIEMRGNCIPSSAWQALYKQDMQNAMNDRLWGTPKKDWTSYRTALVVGNDDYRGFDYSNFQLTSLKNAANDAREVARFLRSMNFQVLCIIDATPRDIEEALSALRLRNDLMPHHFKSVGNEDIAALDKSSQAPNITLFYFAGHGYSYREADWLIPSSIQVVHSSSNASQPILMDDLLNRSLQVNKVLEILKGFRNTYVYALLDTCRGQMILRDDLQEKLVRGQVEYAERSPVRALSEFLEGHSTTEYSLAADNNPDGRNGMFIGYFSKHIQKLLVPFGLAFGSAAKEVKRATLDSQIPVISNTSGEPSVTPFRVPLTECERDLAVLIDSYDMYRLYKRNFCDLKLIARAEASEGCENVSERDGILQKAKAMCAEAQMAEAPRVGDQWTDAQGRQGAKRPFLHSAAYTKVGTGNTIDAFEQIRVTFPATATPVQQLTVNQKDQSYALDLTPREQTLSRHGPDYSRSRSYVSLLNGLYLRAGASKESIPIGTVSSEDELELEEQMPVGDEAQWVRVRRLGDGAVGYVWASSLRPIHAKALILGLLPHQLRPRLSSMGLIRRVGQFAAGFPDSRVSVTAWAYRSGRNADPEWTEATTRLQWTLAALHSSSDFSKLLERRDGRIVAKPRLTSMKESESGVPPNRIEIDITGVPNDLKTAVMWDVAASRILDLKALLQDSGNRRILYSKIDDEVGAVMHIAARMCDPDLIRELADLGFVVNILDARRRSPLDIARTDSECQTESDTSPVEDELIKIHALSGSDILSILNSRRSNAN